MVVSVLLNETPEMQGLIFERHLHATEPTTADRMLSIVTFLKMLPMVRIYL